MTAIEWLMNSDPAIRWQVMRDLAQSQPEEVAKERARISYEGWGARLLSLQGDDGQWAGGACFPANGSDWKLANEGQPWASTLPTLQLLVDFGVDPASERMKQAVRKVEEGCHWEQAGQPFFSGETEPCINGRTVTIGVHFGRDMSALVDRLLEEQLEDGGWNCEAENGSIRSSFATTINVLEGLLAYEKSTGGSTQSKAARHRGEEYLLERALFRRKTTGEVVNPSWLQLSFPCRWHYDILRALDYFQAAASFPDQRLGPAVQIIRSKQRFDHCWLLENTHPGRVHFPLEPGDGKPSRWNTLRALRVLNWFDDIG